MFQPGAPQRTPPRPNVSARRRPYVLWRTMSTDYRLVYPCAAVLLGQLFWKGPFPCIVSLRLQRAGGVCKSHRHPQCANPFPTACANHRPTPGRAAAARGGTKAPSQSTPCPHQRSVRGRPVSTTRAHHTTPHHTTFPRGPRACQAPASARLRKWDTHSFGRGIPASSVCGTSCGRACYHKLSRACAASGLRALPLSLQGQQLRATVVPAPVAQQQQSTFITALNADGQFQFSDVSVVAAYGSAYRLNFSFAATLNIPVLCRRNVV